MTKQLTVGTDPEAFLFDIEKNEYIPSSIYIIGNKENPTDLDDGYKVLCDNVMVEFNIPPVMDKEGFVFAMNTAYERIRRLLPPQVTLLYKEEAQFTKEQLANDPQAREFGCAPQKNLYDLSPIKPENFRPGLRFAGGHIHIGYPLTEEEIPRFIKCMDICVGIRRDLYNKSKYRKLAYGLPGTYRTTDYGIEYRTPSCTWASSNSSIELMWDDIQNSVRLFESAEELPADEEIITAFQNKETAKILLERFVWVQELQFTGL